MKKDRSFLPHYIILWLLDNKPKTRKQKIMEWALSIMVCVCGMFETNPKFDNKPKTQKQKIVGWALSIVVCVCVECSKQTQNSTTNPKLGNKIKANEISLESSSFVHCEYCIFKLLDAKIKFFFNTLYKRAEVLPRGPLVRGPKK